MTPRERAIQAALQLRDELPTMEGADWPALDAELAVLLQAVLLAPADRAAFNALLQFVRSRPAWAARFDALVGGGLRGGSAGAPGVPRAPGLEAREMPLHAARPAARPAADEPQATAQAGSADPPFTPVEILYATDRAATGQAQVQQWYGGERHPEARIEYGRCIVTIPLDRKRGELNSPGLLDFWRGPDSARHIMLARIEPLADAAFAQAAQAQLGEGADEGLLFVHGYNVSFHDAARRTAQLAFDLGFRGLRLCFSWPSRGEFMGYAADGDSAAWAAPHLAQVIRRLRELRPGLRLHLVAHSMGNRVLTQALQELKWKGDAPEQTVQQVALAAPDISCDVFRGLAEALRSSARRVTLYASSNDRALWASRLLHRGPRAGDGGSDIVVVDGIDSVDASRVDSSLVGLNHGYFAGKLSVLSDLMLLLRENAPPERRPGLLRGAGARHWLMQP